MAHAVATRSGDCTCWIYTIAPGVSNLPACTCRYRLTTVPAARTRTYGDNASCNPGRTGSGGVRRAAAAGGLRGDTHVGLSVGGRSGHAASVRGRAGGCTRARPGSCCVTAQVIVVDGNRMSGGAAGRARWSLDAHVGLGVGIRSGGQRLNSSVATRNRQCRLSAS